MLEVNEIDVYYGQSRILRQLSMKVRPGTITAIMGRNGVGKTTLLKAIMGLLSTKAGAIRLDDKPLNGLSPDRRARLGIGYVPQGREIFPRLTIRENLEMGLSARTDGMKELPEDEIYDLFPVLGKMEKRLGGNLSGGQQQQLAIARALVGNPRILLLDEPTEGIQPSIILEIEKALRKLRGKGGLAIVLVEQYLDFARRLGDDYYILDRGAVVSEGKTEALEESEVQRFLAF